MQPVGKSGPLMCCISSVDGDVRIVNLRANAVNDFAQIVRGHVGGHADGDAGAAVDQEVGKGGGKNGRLGEGLVVVGDKIHGVLVHVLHQDGAEMASGGLRCNAWRREGRLRRNRNCPGRRSAVRAWPTAAPCGPASGKSPLSPCGW